MRKFILIVALFLAGCQPSTTPPVYMDLSAHYGRAPLEVVGYVFFYEPYKCAEITWQYWYSGFSMDKNEAKEKVCGKKMVTHEFIFTVPGNVNVQILVRYGDKTYQRRFRVKVSE